MKRLQRLVESPHALPAGIIALLHLVLLRGVFWGSRVVESGDVSAAFYPWQRYAAHALSNGYVPEWFPYSYCGYPFIANIQVHLFHPTTLLSLLWDPIVALSLSMALHMVLASLGAYAYFAYLMRSRSGEVGTARRAPTAYRWAALFGALLFCPAGFFLFRASVGHTTVIYSLAPLGWVCLSVEHLFDGRRRWTVPAIALLLALSLFGGHPQFTLYILMVVAWIVLYRLPGERDARRAWSGSVGWLAAAGVLFVLIASVQLLPTMELIQHLGDREPGSVYQYAVKDSVTVITLLTLLHPNAGGLAEANLHWSSHSGWHEINLFVGIAGAMAALCLLTVIPRKRRGWILAMLVFLLLMAMGSQTPFYPFLYAYFPPVRFFRGAARIQCLLQFFLAMAAALGLARLLDEPGKHTRRVLTGVSVFAGIWIMLLLLMMFFPEGTRVLMARLVNRTYTLHFAPGELPFATGMFDMTRIAATGGLEFTGPYNDLFFRLLAFLPLALIAGALLWWAARGARLALFALIAMLVFETAALFLPSVHLPGRVDYMLHYFPETSTTRFLTEQEHDAPARLLCDDSMYWHGIRKDFEPFFPNRISVHGIYDVRGYDRLVLRRYTEYWNRMIDRAPDEYLGMIMKLPDISLARPEMLARLNAEYLTCTGKVSPETYTRLFEQQIKQWHVTTYRSERNLGPVFLCGESCLSASAEAATELLPGTLVEWSEANPEDFTVRYDASADGVLVWSNIAYPGWYAWVDGKPATVEIAYDTFTAVRVSAGRHAVRFAFRSGSLRLGAGLSLFGLLATLGAFMLLSRRERRWS